MMHDTVSLVWVGLAGIVLGAMFFGGLWWTVRTTMTLRHSAAWLLGSSLLRTGIVLTGFYFVGAGHWQRLLVCLAGFICVRLLLTSLAKPPWTAASRPSGEASRAS